MKRVALLLGTLMMFTAAPASAQLPEGLRFDDAFAFYQVQQRSRMRSGRPEEAYEFQASARILGTNIARNSAFEFTIKRGRRTLGTFICPGVPTALMSREVDSLTVNRCSDRNLELDVTGELTVEVRFIDDNDDEKYLAATHTVTVRNAAGKQPRRRSTQ